MKSARARPASTTQAHLALPLPANDEMECLPQRPIRLLPHPEPIETLATVPDGPPLRFRWRRVLHEIAAIEGPERIAPEWWKDTQALTRDYFRAEDTQGRRFWLYREGLYERETVEAHWFVQGLFA
jgi:protein ImuB